ncbi:hypothetical protein, partial [Enterobacter kobei]|uniref:hypothetical protein n=1 Tax=Enterobacter kobei TaxID=208224 RepID=UPI002072FA39
INQNPLHHTAWNPLHSIGMLWAMLHGIHCIQSGSIGPRCMESTASIGMHFTMLHGIHCIQ